MKKILINANHPEELRFATVEGDTLTGIEIHNSIFNSKKANIYKGTIGHYQASLDSVFVDYGSDRHGFLPVTHVDFSLLGCNEEDIKNKKVDPKEVLKKGDGILVQVEKDERDTKGAFLSMIFCIPGRNVVLLPNSSKATRGISKTFVGEERIQSKELIASLKLPETMGIIIRTAANGKSKDEIQKEIDALVILYKNILSEYESAKSPCLLYADENKIFSFIRDNVNNEVDEVYIDNADVLKEVESKMSFLMTEEIKKIRHYQSTENLFNFFKIEEQVESIHKRELSLPSGGQIIFDPTEALTAIDVNSAKATDRNNIEDTAYHTNIEAANEIAKQLKLRNIGGLLVIDFIDMSSKSNQEKIYRHMLKATASDYARVQIEPITKFGLMELTRQRLQPSIADKSYEICPTCMGNRQIRSVESYAISVLNLIEKNASTSNSTEVVVVVAEAIATFLLNEKNSEVAQLRNRFGKIYIIPSYDHKLHEVEIKRVGGTMRRHSSGGYLEESIQTRKDNKRKFKLNSKKDINEKPTLSLESSGTKKSIIARIFSYFCSLFNVGGGKKYSHKNQRRNYRNRRRKKYRSDNRDNH